MYRIAIVGRPNVGKSSLFNKLTGSRRAIVGNEPGMTRDRIYGLLHADGKEAEIVDTGGIVPEEKAVIPEQVLQQARTAMQESELILLVMDGRDGPTPLDASLVSILRQSGREFWLLVNKIDVPKVETLIFPFHQFGVENVYAVSAEHSLGLEDLVSDLAARLPESTPATPQEEIRVALIGRPNMGKSSLLNQLVGSERSIVTEIPGTTRDAVDTILSSDGTVYRLIDTAGIRRKGKTRGLAEKMGVVMARKSIDRSDVVLLLIDATEGATKLDATVGGYAHEAGKSLIVVVNKWDLIEKDTYTQQALETEFRRRMRFLDHAPMVFVSAKTGQRVMKLLEFVKEASSARKLRVPTGTLNRLVQEKIRPRIPSAGEDRHPLLYVAQVRIAPPTFVLFTRSRKRLHFSVERYFSNQLRAEYGFYATPIRIFQRNRGRRAALSQG